MREQQILFKYSSNIPPEAERTLTVGLEAIFEVVDVGLSSCIDERASSENAR